MLLWTLTAVGWQPYAVQIPCCIVLFCSLFLIIIARYDVKKSHAYIGDSAGQITIMTVTDETSHKVDTMKRHTGRYCLNWFCLLYIAYDVPVNPQCSLYAQFVVPFGHFLFQTTITTVLRPFFRVHPGELVPKENFLTLWCMGRLTEANTPTIRLSTTPSGLSSAHLHHSPCFFTGRIPFLPPNQQCQSTEGKFFFYFRPKWIN